jgi:hypothetical protein
MAHSLFLTGFFALSIGIVPAFAQVEMRQADSDHITITINGQPFSDFYFGANYPKPFLAPLRTAHGLIVTRRYPMENVEGESRDHQHHRGLFIGYGEINGLNFWENEFKYQSNAPKNFDPAKNGKIVLRKLDEVKGGKKSGTIKATFDWVGPDGAPILEEKRTMAFYANPEDQRVLDFDFTLTAKKTAQFADTKEGFFAIRIADSMTEKNGGLMTNSEGAETEKNVWGKRANWVDYDGTVAGQRVGIVIFDHPGNYNHPERWHSRAYGLFAVNPFGLKDFDPKSKDKGDCTLKAGDTLRFRYQVMIHPGDVPKKKLDELYAEYARGK